MLGYIAGFSSGQMLFFFFFSILVRSDTFAESIIIFIF